MEEKTTRQYALKGHGILLLVLAFLAAAIYYFAHPLPFSGRYQGLPGIGFAITHWMLMAGALIAAFREDKKRFIGNFGGYFLLAAALLLGACYGIFGNRAMRLMNAPVLVLVSAQAIFAFSGHHGENPLSGWGWLTAAGRIFPMPFLHFLRPFEAIQERSKEKTHRIKGLGLGLAIGIPVVFAAIFLLASADSMFGDLFSQMFDAIRELSAAFFIRLLFTFVVGLMLFSALFGATMTWRQAAKKKEYQMPAATFSVALGGMAVIYALFAYIQFRYLFGGVETAVMKGGYAVYARSGFFQLVLLSFITLGILLPGLSLCRGSGAVRVLGAVVALLTVVIDVSAFFRMLMYIRQYGLTVLRLVTIWGMLAILIALVLTLVKCIYPAFRMCPALTAALIAAWIGLNFINVDARIAGYNVSAWEKGDIAVLDEEYLAGLSPDVMPALESIGDKELREKTVLEVRTLLEEKYPVDYDWSFSWRHIQAPEAINTPKETNTPEE